MIDTDLSDDSRSLMERRARMDGRVIKPVPDEVFSSIAEGENAVRAIRRHKLLTQKELSVLTGLGENHISNIENGAQFNIRTAKKLAVALEVLIDDIS